MIIATMGANANLRPEEVSKALQGGAGIDLVLSQLEMPFETVLLSAQKAKERGIPFILNPAPPNKITDELIRLSDFLTPNETEAKKYTGIQIINEETALKAAKSPVERGAKTVIITMGAKGAFLFDGTVSKMIPGPTVEAVDTVGAGDTFNGALTVALAEGKSTENGIVFASKAASNAVTRKGAQAGIPYRGEITE